MKSKEREAFALQAEVCKALANPKRLEIIHHLKSRGMLSAADLQKIAHLTKTNLSQHMRVLKASGITESEREGIQVYYRLSSPKIGVACKTLREFLLERLDRQGALVKGVKPQRSSRK